MQRTGLGSPVLLCMKKEFRNAGNIVKIFPSKECKTKTIEAEYNTTKGNLMKDIKRRSISMILAATLFFGMTFTNVYADDEIQEIPEETATVQEAVEEKNKMEQNEQEEQIEKIEEAVKAMPAFEESVFEEIKKVPAAAELKKEMKEMPAEELREEIAEVPAEEKAPEVQEMPAEEKAAEVQEVPAEEKIAEVQEVPAEEKIAETKAAPAEEKIAEVQEMPVEKKEAAAELVKELAEKAPAELINDNVENAPVELIKEVAEAPEAAKEAVIEDIAEAEEEIEEEPEWVSDAVSMNVTGDTTVYLENPDQTTKLTATNKNENNKAADDQEIIWSSANESVATVDQNGLVTIVTNKANKSVKITATAANVPGLSVTKTVYTRNVTAKNIGVSMSSPTNSYMEGVPVQFTASFTNEFAIEALGLEVEAIWTVGNGGGEGTISEDGLLTPIKEGKVKVTLSNNVNTSKSSKNITIKAPTPVSKLTMNSSAATLTMQGEMAPTKALKATVSPSTATNKEIFWSSNDESVATVDKHGLVTAVGEGTAIITAVSESDPDVTATSVITVVDLDNKEYEVNVKHYFTKTFVCEEMYNGVPSSFAFMMEDKVQTVKHGATVDPGDYIMDAPLEYPHIFEYDGQKYMLSGSYVAADGVYGDATFEAKSDIDIIYTYSAIAPYTLTVNYLNAETKEPIEKAYTMKYESQLGYIEVPYNVANFLEKKMTAFEGYMFETMEGDLNKPWSEESADHIINMYFAEIKPVVEEPTEEEPVVEDPVIEEPIAEDPVIEEPIVEEPEIEEPVAEEPVIEEPVAEEPVIEEPVVEEPVIEEPIVEEPVIEEPVVEEPMIEEPVVEEPMIEEPIVEEPVIEKTIIEESVADESVIEEEAEAEAPVDEIEEPAHKTRRAEKEEPVEETTSDETEEIAEEETPLSDFHEEEAEEVIAENDAPMAAYEVAETEEVEETEVPLVVNSPLTGDERHTAAWAGLSLVSLLGILFLGRKKRMTE